MKRILPRRNYLVGDDVENIVHYITRTRIYDWTRKKEDSISFIADRTRKRKRELKTGILFPGG